MKKIDMKKNHMSALGHHRHQTCIQFSMKYSISDKQLFYVMKFLNTMTS